ncbi:MAG: beta-lactamase family protein [Hyphomonadaceae bacterium]|nr:beta-lactamase family protein [Hyphomonadaceae bacterium]
MAGGLGIDDAGQLWPPPSQFVLCAGLIARAGDGGAAMERAEGRTLRADVSFTLDSTFRVASVSKMVTAAGFMRLAERDRLDLNRDVSRYLRSPLRHPAYPDTPITCRQLLSHTSGLRNGADFPVPFSGDLLARLRLAEREPGYGGWYAGERPGDFFGYCDTNFGVIAQVIERVSGQRFDLYMREAMFAPLGLDCGYNWSGVSQAARDRAAAGARLRDGAWIAEVDASPPQSPGVSMYQGDATEPPRLESYELSQNGLAFSPHGGLRLSLRNMDTLARCFAHGDERILSRATLQRMQRPAWVHCMQDRNGLTEHGFYARYGLGVHLPARGARDAFAGMPAGWRGHFGDAYGWMTGLLWNARTRDTIVYALNGMPETDRPQGEVSALTAPEELLIAAALKALTRSG